MDNYLILKFVHILCAAVLAGTGAGIAFFMLKASRTNNITVILATARFVILADWIFTAPAVVGQFISGMLLMQYLHFSFTSMWFLSVISLFLFIGFCWVPVIFIQYKLKNIAEAGALTGQLNVAFFKWIKVWMALGIPAFISILLIFWLMVAKPLAVA